ncbi:MAG: hypothetical protein R2762_16905 [Bryobacteraceae bacterium]
MQLTRSCLPILALVAAMSAHGQTKSLSLDSASGLTLHNAVAAPVTFEGKKAIKVTISPQAADADGASGRWQERGQKKGGGPGAGEANRMDHLGIVDGVEFANGTIELDLAGEPGSGAAGGARGFVGIAFRVQPDRKTYDAFYLRPTNGRSDDQERRNHSAQYISHPAYPWFKLRQETPSKYETYVDIQPAKWIHVKVVVDGEKARLYVNGSDQPALVVNDVKSGAGGKGAVALWFEGSTIAHYANLRIESK